MGKLRVYMTLIYEAVKHSSGDVCPSCSAERDKGGRLNARPMKGSLYVWLGCSRFPDCKYSLPARLTRDNEPKFLKERKRTEAEYEKWEKKAGLSQAEKKEYGERMRFIRGL